MSLKPTYGRIPPCSTTPPSTNRPLPQVAIIALGAFLRFYRLGAHIIVNTYYAATVQSMLTSWHNFFYASFEPGGSVSVDKPPLGFWLQALSAYFLGVSGFSLALPQALAGVLSIPLLYSMVKRQFGAGAGLIAALALAVMPVTIATERNNTIDGTLVFVLLLAAWAVLRSVRLGKFRYLLLGVFLVGLGFNIKMLQAFMVVPALYALYLFGAPHRWWKRLVHLAAATALLLVVSLSWAVAVDLTPAANRPFPGDGPRFPPPNGGPIPQGPNGNGGAPGGSQEVGKAGPLRLFTAPLAEEASWLLPLALMGLVLLALTLGWRRPLTEQHLALVLWAGWLLPMMLYFSFTTGLWHAYYLIMLGPGLAALVGATAWALWQLIHKRRWTGWLVVAVMSGLTVAFEIVTLWQYPAMALPVTAISVTAWLVGIVLLAWRGQPAWTTRASVALVCASLLVAPLTFSGVTTFNANANVALPSAGSSAGGGPAGGAANGELSPMQKIILDYLLANTPADGYLAAALDSHAAAPYILATQRAVLTMGGFNGGDNVISAEGLAQLVAVGKLRFVLDTGQLSRKADIASWVTRNCATVSLPGVSPAPRNAAPNGAPRVDDGGQQPPQNLGAPRGLNGVPVPGPGGSPAGGVQGTTVYDCGK
ncbi:MAG: glycosyltransferase family 39 protein [Chloroflexi bacterium]|nr:glycosyltransferase family 39 protein [Chloroflexota bacterium]